MAVNPLQMGSDSQTKSKDIKVDRVDLSIGGLRMLTDASFTLAYGHRYGLVGQNGIGKSTLLRALSRREVAVPTHISILHVDQEVSAITFCYLQPLFFFFSSRVAVESNHSDIPCPVQITGDDTPTLQAVLDADVWRKHLLIEQDVSSPSFPFSL